MNSLFIFQAIMKLVKGFFGLFHSENDSAVRLMLTIGVQEAALDHPAIKEVLIKVSQKIIDGIDGKLFVDSADAISLLKQELESGKIDPHVRILLNGMIVTYGAQLTEFFSKNKITEPLDQMEEVRKIAMDVNIAAGGSAT